MAAHVMRALAAEQSEVSPEPAARHLRGF
ncbi:hypothetical protein ACLK2F_10100 [Escherichia coli]